jgi:hypothetical protein
MSQKSKKRDIEAPATSREGREKMITFGLREKTRRERNIINNNSTIMKEERISWRCSNLRRSWKKCNKWPGQISDGHSRLEMLFKGQSRQPIIDMLKKKEDQILKDL